MTKEQPQPQEGWLHVRRFEDVPAATSAYERARDLLLIDHDFDASILRFTLDGVSHIAVIGECALDAREQDLLDRAIAAGEPGELPGPVVLELRRRRAAFKGLDLAYLERRTVNEQADVDSLKVRDHEERPDGRD